MGVSKQKEKAKENVQGRSLSFFSVPEPKGQRDKHSDAQSGTGFFAQVPSAHCTAYLSMPVGATRIQTPKPLFLLSYDVSSSNPI